MWSEASAKKTCVTTGSHEGVCWRIEEFRLSVGPERLVVARPPSWGISLGGVGGWALRLLPRRGLIDYMRFYPLGPYVFNCFCLVWVGGSSNR